MDVASSKVSSDRLPPEASSRTEFLIGLILAFSSSAFIGTSFILTKKGLQKLSIRAGQGGYGYLREGMWWGGMILMTIGEIANFTAYVFAPATLVTPLGALSVLVSAVLASRVLGEHVNMLGKMGCVLCVVGATILVIHCPKEQELNTMDELAVLLQNAVFIIYVALVALSAVTLIYYYSPRFGQRNPLVYITVTGSIGSLSVMGCKALGVAIKQTLRGDNQLTNWLTWFIIITVACCIAVQMNYLNKALDVFETSIVTTILYVIFTSCVILASTILFNEWAVLTATDIIGNLCGFVTVIVGMVLLQAFKDVSVPAVSMFRTRRVDLSTRDSAPLMSVAGDTDD